MIKPNKLISVIMSIAVSSALVSTPAIAFASQEPLTVAELSATETNSYIKINNDYVYSDTYSKNGISWDAKSRTLTLNNVSTDIKESTNSSYNIYVPTTIKDKVTIVLKGNNNFKNVGNKQYAIAICVSDADVDIVGNGSLNCYNIAALNCNNLNIKSGTVNINKSADDAAIWSNGRIKVAKGVKLSAVNGSSYSSRIAIYAKNGMSNDYSSLVKVDGRLPEGAKFKTKNAQFQVNPSDRYAVTLVKWLSGTSFNAKYGLSLNGATYDVTKISANAFNNKAGKKVKSLTLSSSVKQIGKNAFKGTSSLTKLNIRKAYGIYSWKYKSGKYTFKINSGVNSKAFSGMGKKSGKKLNVYTSWVGKANTQFKSTLVKKGMPKSVSMKS